MCLKDRRIFVGMVAVLLLLHPDSTNAQDVQITNTYRYAGDARFKWTVFVKAEKSTLDRISCVEYTLHPTFPNPIRRVCNSNRGFALDAEGWGEFTIFVKIEWRDKRVTRQSYRLRLHSAAEKSPASEPAPIRAGNTSQYLGGGTWSWTVFIVANKRTLDTIRCIEYMLHPTFSPPVRRICEAGNLATQAFPLAARGGGTFDVGIKVLFRDGRSQFMRHTLKFEGK